MAEGGLRSHGLSCSICLDGFETPKFLSCGHTFCLPCVDKMVDRSGMRPSLQCPACRQFVYFPESGKTQDLVTNFQVLEILDQTKAQKNPEGRGGYSIEMNDKIADASSQCKLHHIETLLYCKTCAIPVCVNCTLGEHDVGKHDICKKGDFVTQQMKQTSEITDVLRGMKAEYAKLEASFTERKQKYDKRKHDLEKRVCDEFEERQRLLKEDRDKLLAEIISSTCEKDEGMKMLSDYLTSQKNSLEIVEKETERMTDELNTQKTTDGKRVTETSQKLQKISIALAKLEQCINSAPTEPGLNFEVANTKGRIGTVNKPFKIASDNPDGQNYERACVDYDAYDDYDYYNGTYCDDYDDYGGTYCDDLYD